MGATCGCDADDKHRTESALDKAPVPRQRSRPGMQHGQTQSDELTTSSFMFRAADDIVAEFQSDGSDTELYGLENLEDSSDEPSPRARAKSSETDEHGLQIDLE